MSPSVTVWSKGGDDNVGATPEKQELSMKSFRVDAKTKNLFKERSQTEAPE